MSKKLEDYSKEELLAYIRQLHKDTKFGLVWNPKEEKIALDCKVNIPVLQAVPEKTIAKANDDEPTHLLIEGDNYHSLSVLNYTHAGKVDVIYIDPPYNTGNKDFIYNDKYVDREDPYRHSEWLSFMDNRLRLAKNLLSDNGVIFISIDDNEQAHLKILCDTIFGEENFIAQIIWEKKFSPQNDAKWFSDNHDYMLVYGKQKELWKPIKLPRDLQGASRFSNPDNDPRGDWASSDMTVRTYSANYDYPIKTPSGKEVSPTNGRSWSMPVSKYEELLKDGRIWFGKNGNNVPRIKTFAAELTEGIVPLTLWKHQEVGHNQEARQELKKIFDGKGVFDSPKPTRLIERVLRLTTSPDKPSIILDCFAGSGTTGHAVLKLNQEDGGKRQFILGTDSGKAEEGGVNIAENITYERIVKVVDGYGNTDAIPANLRYFKTDFVETNGISKLTDNDKLEITKEMGAMIALRENSFDQIEQTGYWQTYENASQVTAIYFREDKTMIDEYLDKLNAQDKPVKLYVFGWGKNAGLEYASQKISVEDIPEPLIEVYKEIVK